MVQRFGHSRTDGKEASYRTGGVSKKHFGRKHDSILFYTKTDDYTFNLLFDKSYVPTLPKPHTPSGARLGIQQDQRGQFRMVHARDVWEIDSLFRNDQERLGYPTQKPEALLDRIITASSNQDNIILDPFCGCGTSIAVAHKLQRQWLGIDVSPTACKLIKRRLEQDEAEDVQIIGLPMSIDQLKELEPFEFQNWIVGALGGIPSKKKVHDMGIDGYTFFDRVPVQVKQSEHVGRPVVDDFETALRRYGEGAVKAAKERKNSHFALQGIIVAFSFTKGAHEEVARAKGEGIDIQLLTVAEVVKEFEQ